MKRTIPIILALCVMFTICFTGCGSSSSSGQGTGTSDASASTAQVQASSAEPSTVDNASANVTVSAFIEGDPSLDYTKNYAANYFTEKTGVHFDFKVVSSADANTKKNLMLSSGDYPDIFLTGWQSIFTRNDIMQYGVKDKILIPLNKYIDKDGMELKRIWGLRPGDKAAMTAPDGNIYGIPRFSECYHCTAYPKLWFNYDWLKKLNLSEPQTTDDLEKVLLAFKNNDPNSNGKKDEIPLTGAITWSCPLEYFMMNSFIPTDFTSFLYSKSGKVTFSADKPEWKTGLQYLHKLYKEGLIDPAAFTQKDDQMAQVVRKDPFTVGGYTSDHEAMGIDINNRAAMEAYHALPPVQGPTGARWQSSQSFESQLSGFMGVITDKCKNPEAVYKLFDFMLSEQSTMIDQWGKEGLNWNRAPDGTKSVSGGAAKYVLVQPKNDAEKKTMANMALGAGPSADLKEVRDAWMPAVQDLNDSNNYEARLNAETDKVVKYLYPETLPREMFMEQATQDEFTEIKTNLVDFVKKSTVQFITGDKNIDTEWDKYISDLQKYKLDRYLKIYQDTFDKFNAAKNK